MQMVDLTVVFQSLKGRYYGNQLLGRIATCIHLTGIPTRIGGLQR